MTKSKEKRKKTTFVIFTKFIQCFISMLYVIPSLFAVLNKPARISMFPYVSSFLITWNGNLFWGMLTRS